MNTNRVLFAIRKEGYDYEQVDRYINKLTDEYTSMQKKYTELFGKYEALSKQSDVGLTAVSKAIVDAEVRAFQIIAEANNEAAQIKEGAHVELVHIQQEKDRVINEIFEIINGLKRLVPFSIGRI